MVSPELYVFVGGLLHFAILLASALTPQVLDWKTSLCKLDPLSRQVIWVHGAFIIFVIIGFGTLSAALPEELVSGTVLARVVCVFIAAFWALRLVVQGFVFDAKPYLRTPFLRLGYHSLTVVFAYHVVVYSWAAVLPASGT